MFRFTIRDVLWLTVVLALGFWCWRAYSRIARLADQNLNLKLEAATQDKIIEGLTNERDRLNKDESATPNR